LNTWFTITNLIKPSLAVQSLSIPARSRGWKSKKVCEVEPLLVARKPQGPVAGQAKRGKR
jgi:hypothetical protein